jgi:plasmid stabilization system protein ParE
MRKVIISDKAKDNIIALFEYLELKWSVKVRVDFANKLYGSIKTIKQNPEIFPKSQINKIHYKSVVSKQTTLFYKFNAKEIQILAFFDTRQNPSKINKIK